MKGQRETISAMDLSPRPMGKGKWMVSSTPGILRTVMAPSGGDSFTSVSGEKMGYTVKEEVNYMNNDLPVEITWAKASEFVKGKYKVEIYQAGSVIGTSSIDLK